ncbi:hypothetical protein IAT40_006834 [Kwoniella sp. CBS 6097]
MTDHSESGIGSDSGTDSFMVPTPTESEKHLDFGFGPAQTEARLSSEHTKETLLHSGESLYSKPGFTQVSDQPKSAGSHDFHCTARESATTETDATATTGAAGTSHPKQGSLDADEIASAKRSLAASRQAIIQAKEAFERYCAVSAGSVSAFETQGTRTSTSTSEADPPTMGPVDDPSSAKEGFLQAVHVSQSCWDDMPISDLGLITSWAKGEKLPDGDKSLMAQAKEWTSGSLYTDHWELQCEAPKVKFS